MKVRWLKKASGDLDALFDFIAQDRPDAAVTEVLLVLGSVEHLAAHPALGRPGRVPETRELIVANYLVAYRVKGSFVEVLRVLHASRKWPKRIP